MTHSATPMTDTHFCYRNGVLHAENVALPHIAQELGTPTFVYSRRALHDAWDSYRQATKGHNALVCYGMKANSNLAVINEFKELGAGFDIVSGGELARVLAVGADPSKVVFSGVGKQAWEMQAALEAGVKCFNVESAAELERLAEQAQLAGKRAAISLRVNPDVDAFTHPYISTGLKENKFGIPIDLALSVYQRAAQLGSLEIVGIDCHIGSQITKADPYLDALDKLLVLIRQLGEHGIAIKHIDLGGGLGIRYKDETPLLPSTLVSQVFARLNECGLGHIELVLEPGRSLVGNAGILLTQVQYLKHNEGKNFAIVDAAMNDLIRPTLYDAWHNVLPVNQASHGAAERYDIVGPICESGDWLARDRELALAQNDLLAILSTGAYGFTMASHYNTRARAAEVMVDGDNYHVVRPRETIDSLFATETTWPLKAPLL